MKILLINGPNLNLLGQREVEKYGNETLDDIVQRLRRQLPSSVDLVDYQSNHEGALMEFIQKEGPSAQAIIINAASYTHTSIGIRDALAFAQTPFIEVHITNVYRREPFRKTSYLSEIAVGVIAGCGSQSYDLALKYFLDKYNV